MIAIIDYGMGNLRSVSKALEHVGVEYVITDNADVIQDSTAILLPGVGAFPKAMKELHDRGLITLIREQAHMGKPILGICLGMQLLFESSEEIEPTEGLGLLPGTIRKIPAGRKIPHMGWNNLQKRKDSPLLKDVQDGAYVYYVHSFYADCPEEVIDAGSEYGVFAPGVVSKGNIFGAQFHPEKSSEIGLKMLQNFKELVTC
ncbi:imidazole glycerol phosphate synthase subunit HisH [Ectobacillus antri]|jgi:glutamine amidotransferase|uniref:Imidazole glycerol phosphate synthase subunit HisH n=1 Tax=Ectobacillus antri TaxID=2486280 RepID=A0ABT6H588_9BACI|nr:imidazole glycerol phosphate synthase subunit HisH [Ectobacillus antri]MDG4656878.1 imidazole glycerol phosphate synthase subunit HisH [Ectobacillus antri]MDG5754225.1 imidazole glycerol phosphate synthase subunit HisH [Ectobacillus antri]